MTKYGRLMKAAASHYWAIQEEKLDQIFEFLEFAASGGKYSPDEVAARIGARADNTHQVQVAKASQIAVIPIRGIIAQRASMLNEISSGGGASTEQISADLRRHLADDSIKSILFDVDSPGGSVFGVEELAAEIFAARGRKPIVAQVNAVAGSAAYYLASAADEIAITPSGEAGSIGVIMRHLDQSKSAEMEGVKVTYIHAGEFKAEGNSFEPLGDNAKAFLQKRVDEYSAMFVKAVARGRGVPPSKVRAEFGRGRMFGADEALSVGMVDRIATFDDTVRRLAGRKGASLTGILSAAATDTATITAAMIEAAEPMAAQADTGKAYRESERRKLALI